MSWENFQNNLLTRLVTFLTQTWEGLYFKTIALMLNTETMQIVNDWLFIPHINLIFPLSPVGFQ